MLLCGKSKDERKGRKEELRRALCGAIIWAGKGCHVRRMQLLMLMLTLMLVLMLMPVVLPMCLQCPMCREDIEAVLHLMM